jgi:DNA polymerase III epsilon subunit family exonuclease
MDPHLRASKLDEAFELISRNPRPTSSYLIGTRILELRLRDKRQIRRAVRCLLCQDSRFQEVHAGQWEALNHDYGRVDLDQAEFRVLDLEVTGSDPARHAIIDVGVFRVRGNRIEPLLSTLVNPQLPIPVSIQRLTGIRESMVRRAPTFSDILPRLLEVLSQGIFVAHNVAFDYHFLKTWIEGETGERFTAPHLCTVKLSQRLIETKSGSRKLHHLARQLGIPLQNRHRAHDDAYATARILLELLGKLRERGLTTVEETKLFESGLALIDDRANGKSSRNGKPAVGTERAADEPDAAAESTGTA